MKSWIETLKSCKLDKKDQKTVNRFLSKPFNQSFLSVVDILKRYDCKDEAFELLNYGISKFPEYVAAHVQLAKELFEKGLVQDAYESIKNIKAPIHENILAQKILFKVAVLNEHESAAKSIAQHMNHRRILDQETEAIVKRINIGGVKSAKEFLMKYFENKGTNICQVLSPNIQKSGEIQRNIGKNNLKNSEVFHFNHRVIADPSLKHYNVVPLSEIFSGNDELPEFEKPTSTKRLESQTLAEIYKKQGHYEKSLEIYRRLLKISPGNDYLKRMVVDLAKKVEAQQRQDLMIDPALVEYENGPKNKGNLKIYQHLLDKLGNEKSP